MVGQAWLVFVVAFLACALTLGPFVLAPELRAQARSRHPPPLPPSGSRSERPRSLAGGYDADDTDDADDADPATLHQSRMQVLKFLERSLCNLDGKGRADSFTRFGCNLYLAGGCEIVAHGGRLTHKQMEDILASGVRALGTSGDTARRFSGKYDEYLLEPKYIWMFKAGRDAMNRFLAPEADDAAGALAKALEQWYRRDGDDDDEPGGPTTVVFTDIVGSTRMNQTLGDATAQLVVHAHNGIVRASLDRYEGTEVKHTGDGIMAAFRNTANAVEACIDMQRDCTAHNAADPVHPLEMRIGLNAGEPIAEDGDLFGATVQLAARICDKALAGQILVSGVVRELCAGKLIRFKKGSESLLSG